MSSSSSPYSQRLIFIDNMTKAMISNLNSLFHFLFGATLFQKVFLPFITVEEIEAPLGLNYLSREIH